MFTKARKSRKRPDATHHGTNFCFVPNHGAPPRPAILLLLLRAPSAYLGTRFIKRLRLSREAGFDGIGLSFPDPQAFARRHCSRDIAEDDCKVLCETGRLCGACVLGTSSKSWVSNPYPIFRGVLKGVCNAEMPLRRLRPGSTSWKQLGQTCSRSDHPTRRI